MYWAVGKGRRSRLKEGRKDGCHVFGWMHVLQRYTVVMEMTIKRSI